MLIETEKLETVKSYARRNDLSPQYIYLLIKAKKLNHIEIDNVKFILNEPICKGTITE